MLRNFRKPAQKDKRRYLKYDDVFLGGKRSRNESSGFQEISPRTPINNNYSNSYRESEEQYIEENEDLSSEGIQYYPHEEQQKTEYFSGRNNIIDERMMKYQKRQLPPLQRYSPNTYRDAYSEFNQAYWDEEYSSRRYPNTNSLKLLWHKFILTFASIISLVCVAWIAYNWNNDHTSSRHRITQDGIPLIEPEQEEFKVLPDNPGGMEIPYKDKTVYERVNNKSIENQEKLLPPQNDVSYLSSSQNVVEEYSIIDDRTYYIKISAGKTKPILQNELKLLKKKYADYINDKNCSIKRVSNSSGEKKYAILVGPFDAQEKAIDIARSIGGQCYVISVKE